MNQEELALMIEMQPVLLPVKGDWQVGDKVFYLEYRPYGVGILTVEVPIGKNLVAVDFPDQDTVRLEFNFGDPSLLWLPLPIDPENPSRGCWSMLTMESKTDKIFLNELASSNNPLLVILEKLKSQRR